MRFEGICLITSDVNRLAEFYCKVLEVESEGDDIHQEVHTDGAELAIFSKEGMEEMAPGCMTGAGNGSFTLGFLVEDVDSAYRRLLNLGVEIVKPPITYPWGTRSAWFRDPDGNIINYFEVVGED